MKTLTTLFIFALSYQCVLAQPVGSITAFAGPYRKIPNGWLPCDGRGLNKNQYPSLFNAIGTSWGGDAVNNFYLPNLRGLFLRGDDPNDRNRIVSRPDLAEQGNIYGVGSLQEYSTALPKDSTRQFIATNSGDHTHGIAAGLQGNIVYHSAVGVGRPYLHDQPGNGVHQFSETPSLTNNGTHSHAIKGGEAETRPKNVSVIYIIKYQ